MRFFRTARLSSSSSLLYKPSFLLIVQFVEPLLDGFGLPAELTGLFAIALDDFRRSIDTGAFATLDGLQQLLEAVLKLLTFLVFQVLLVIGVASGWAINAWVDGVGINDGLERIHLCKEIAHLITVFHLGITVAEAAVDFAQPFAELVFLVAIAHHDAWVFNVLAFKDD